MALRNIPLFGVVRTEQVEAAALEAIRSGAISSGPCVVAFESALSELTGQSNIVTTVDMSAAMLLALHIAGVRAGDEVLASPFACLSTNSAIAQIGASPLWLDINADTVEISLEDLRRKVSARTRAVIVYHAAGYPSPIGEVVDHCRKRGVPVIEDCNAGLLATYQGRQVGSFGDFAVFSFYPNRQINCLEGGALVCRRPEDAERARRLRRFGIDYQSFRLRDGEINPKSDIGEVGWSFAMNNVCAATGLAQFDTLRSRLHHTRQNAGALITQLRNVVGIEPIAVRDESCPAYWVALFRSKDRNRLLAGLKARGVGCSGLHMRTDAYTGFGSRDSGNLPGVEQVQAELVALPCGWWLQAPDVQYVADAVKTVARHERTNGSPS